MHSQQNMFEDSFLHSCLLQMHVYLGYHLLSQDMFVKAVDRINVSLLLYVSVHLSSRKSIR